MNTYRKLKEVKSSILKIIPTSFSDYLIKTNLIGAYHNPIIGLYFDIFVRKYRIEGLEFLIPKQLTTLSFRSRFVFDLYEVPERYLLKKYLNKDDHIIEFGGGLGVVSCIANKIINKGNTHIVYEANKQIIPWIEKNRDLNNRFFTISNKALGINEFVSIRRFVNFEENTIITDQVDGDNIPTVTLSDLLEDKKINFVICDTEGGEYFLITKYIDFLKQCRGFICEFHPDIIGKNKVDEIYSILKKINYKLVESLGRVQYWENSLTK